MDRLRRQERKTKEKLRDQAKRRGKEYRQA